MLKPTKKLVNSLPKILRQLPFGIQMSTASRTHNFPDWLEHVHTTPTYLTDVIETLTEREEIRESAREASRHSTHSSRTHRLVHLPSFLTKDSEKTSHYSISVGCQPEHRARNRYSNVEPYDRQRVVVEHGSAEPLGRYLNANWVRELAGGKWWIATQAPLPETVHAYLSVLLQPIVRAPAHSHPVFNSRADFNSKTSQIRTVVQLTQDFESGMRKAHVYFPPIVGESWIVEPEPGCNAPKLKVTLLSVKDIDEAHCVQSTVSIQPISPSHQDEGEPVVFRHLLYASWPDHGVPKRENRLALFKFIHLADSINRDLCDQPAESRDQLDSDPPIMVNCSAGIGRTGCFIAVSSLFRKYGFLPPSTSNLYDPSKDHLPLPPSPIGPLPAGFTRDLVAQEIDALREQRPGMLQRPSQVTLVYEMLMAAFASASTT